MTRLVAAIVFVALASFVAFSVGSGDNPGSADEDSGDLAADAEQATSETDERAIVEAPPILADRVPPLEQLDGWLQSDVTSLAELAGDVVVVHFWTFGCINCKRTLPNLQDMYAKYHDEGLEIVGVHAPEFSYEAEVANIEAAAADLGVSWPIALDTEKFNFRAWQEGRRFWPRTYVIDREGRLRFDHIGEGAYDELQATVAYLIAEDA